MRTMLPRGILLIIACLTAFILPGPEVCAAGCADPEPEEARPDYPPFVKSQTRDVTCYPGTIYAPEGKWTFFLRGHDVLEISGAKLMAGGATYPMKRMENPSPNSALIDFEFPELTRGEGAHLVLTRRGTEIERFALYVSSGDRIPPGERQDARVRVQLQAGTILYPLHGFPNDRREIKDRTVPELGGDPEFLAILQEMGVQRVRKVLSRYAEDDSVHWDDRFLRNNFYRGTQLRQYLAHFEPGRSEAAYKEIFLALDQVEDAFINADRSKRSGGGH